MGLATGRAVPSGGGGCALRWEILPCPTSCLTQLAVAMARFQQNGILPATGALVAVLLFSGGAGAGPWMAPPPPPDAPEELRTAIEKADQLFRKRHVAQEDLIAHLEAVVARWPRSWDAQWRMARAASWSAELAKDRKVRRGWGEVAWKAAEKAVQLEPGRAEGHYSERETTPRRWG